MKKNKVFKIAILTLVAAAIPFFFSGSTFADDVDYSVNVTNSLKLTIPKTSINLILDPSTKPFDSEDLTIIVGTNSITGYQLMMSSDSTNLVKTNDDTKTIPTLDPLDGGYTLDNFTANKWGYKVGAGNYVPFVSGDTIVDKDVIANNDTNVINFATKIDFLQPAGEYNMTLTFTAVAHPYILYMQDITAGQCTTYPNTVIDNRDGSEYLVQRLADGNCWMLDNLRLDPSQISLETLKGNTNASDQNLTYLKNGIGTGAYPNFGVSSAWTSSSQNKYEIPYVAVGDKDTVAPTTYGIGSGKIGVYYNYCAASARSYCYAQNYGAGNSPEDICPAKWRLPTGGENGDYQKLFLAYSSNIADFNTALSAPISGYFISGSAGYLDSNGSFWTSTYSDKSNMLGLYNNATTVNVSDNANRNGGRTIRCMLKGDDLTSVTYLQDVTRDMVNNTTPGVAITLKDKRDEEEYKVARLKDGNAWTLDNLRLDLLTVPLENLKGDTNATDEALTYLKNGGGTSPYPAVAVSGSYASASDRPVAYTASKDDTESTVHGLGSGKYGVYYSLCAASAGSYCFVSGRNSGDVNYDVCPTNWRLPTGGVNGEYDTLYATYLSNNSNFVNGLGITYSGNLTGATPSGQNSWAAIWSSTRYNEYGVYYLTTYSGTWSGSKGGQSNYVGLPVRCVAK